MDVMNLFELNKSIKTKFDNFHRNIKLLCQIPLTEDEYTTAKDLASECFISKDEIAKFSEEFPLLFCKLICEISFRVFNPGTRNNDESKWLWNNFTNEVPECPGSATHKVGPLFKKTLRKLKAKFYSSIIFEDFPSGWQYESIILVHSGIPVKNIHHILKEFSGDGDSQAEDLEYSSEYIQQKLQASTRFNIYTKKIIDIDVGVQLVKNILKIYRLHQNGHQFNSDEMLEQGIAKITLDEIKNYKSNPIPSHSFTIRKKQTSLYWDVENDEIYLNTSNLRRKNGEPIQKWIIKSYDKTVEEILNVGGKIKIDKPEYLIEHLIVDASNDDIEVESPFKGMKETPSFLIFHYRFFQMIDENALKGKGVLAETEYLCLLKRNINIEDIFFNDYEYKIEEKNFLVPKLWQKEYLGIRISFKAQESVSFKSYLNYTENVQIPVIKKSQHVPIELSGHNLFLHLDTIGIKTPVFGGESPPAILLLAPVIVKPILQIELNETGIWRPLNSGKTGMEWKDYLSGLKVSFGDEASEKLQRQNLPVLIRIRPIDLSLESIEFDEISFLWIPYARAQFSCGLLAVNQFPKYRLVVKKTDTLEITFSDAEVEQESGDTVFTFKLTQPVNKVRFEINFQGKKGTKLPLNLSWINYSKFLTSALYIEREKGFIPALCFPKQDKIDYTKKEKWLDHIILIHWWPFLNINCFRSGEQIYIFNPDKNGNDWLKLTSQVIDENNFISGEIKFDGYPELVPQMNQILLNFTDPKWQPPMDVLRTPATDELFDDLFQYQAVLRRVFISISKQNKNMTHFCERGFVRYPLKNSQARVDILTETLEKIKLHFEACIQNDASEIKMINEFKYLKFMLSRLQFKLRQLN